MARAVCALALTVGLCCSSTACPTALLQIPTTDVLDKHTGCIDIGGTMYTDAAPAAGDLLVDTQFATSGNVEFGYDFAVDAPMDGILNAKWRFDDDGPTTWAVGFQGLQTTNPLGPFAYAVGQRQHGKWCYHLGAAWDAPGRHGHAFGGVSYNANDHFTWMADYVTGADGLLTAGFSTTFGEDDDWCLMVGYVRDNEGGRHGVYVDVGSLITF